MLKAFKTMDPNGNGQADEIPMTGSIQDALLNIDSFLMNAFVLHKTDSNQLIFDGNGNIDINYNKEGYKEGLQYLNRLFSEGLIDPAAFTQNNNQVKALIEIGEATVGVISAFVTPQFADIGKDRWKGY
jgi:putative aldouronate transport system substrate-binding protein